MKTIQRYLLFFLIISHFSGAQELPPIQNFDPVTYQAGNQNWMITQDKSGYIYTANNQGLLEYNGSHWNLYKTPNESIMRSVHVRDDLIFTGCYRDFGYWSRNNKGLLEYTSIVKKSNLELGEDEEFWSIQSAGNQILFQSLSHIYVYNIETGGIKPIVSDEVIHKFFKTGNNYYFQVLNKGLYQLENGASVLKYPSTAIGTIGFVQLFTQNNTLQAITSQGEILQLEDGQITNKTSIAINEGLAVYDAILLKNGSIALGTIANGLMVISPQGELLYQINQALGLLNNTCLSIFEDSKEHLWIGLDKGVCTIQPNSGVSVFNDYKGVLGTVHTAFKLEDNLYVGTNQGLFIKKGNDNFKFVQGTQGQVWNLDFLDGVLFCNHNIGLFVVDEDKVTPISISTGFWKTLKIKDNTYLSGSYKGLYLLESKESGFESTPIKGFSISSKAIAIDADDTVFINHEYKGVYKITLNDALTTALSVEKIETLPKGIGSDIISFKGDIIYSKRGSVHVKKRTDSNFRPNAKLSKIVEDINYTSASLVEENGFLWMFNQNNIFQIDTEDINGSFSIKEIPFQYNFRREKIGYENIHHIGNDDYLLGTSFGYLSLNTENTSDEYYKPVITSVVTRDNNSEKYRSLIDGIDFNNNIGTISIRYTVPTFNILDQVEYSYKLQDESWSTWSTNASTQLKNLSFGDYTFKLKSRINGAVLEDTASFNFTIQRPGYLSNTAIVIYVLLTIVLVGLLNGFYIWYFKRKKNAALQKQQQELELKNLENEKRIVELRNSKLRGDIELRNKELAVATMAMIKKNETLNELKSQLSKLPEATETKSLRNLVDKNLNSKQDWITFEEAFNNADKDFFKKIKERHPNLTSGDLRLCVYLRLNLSSKEIAPLLNISPRSVEIKRYRLRKKLGLDRDISLSGYIVDI
ncbi:hypothetical protein BST91_06685 [Nonlabens tegetincola]|uniref:hypothetical protein n=1 Tax=Nonlabens tegetincola TaxID=323273 RepID=UPI000A20B157|nr:hypothetical protein [Nonlabens tegetincola]ARN71345.1 hypothetical protein BST91_06685 [Nonlabens tegetincola]